MNTTLARWTALGLLAGFVLVGCTSPSDPIRVLPAPSTMPPTSASDLSLLSSTATPSITNSLIRATATPDRTQAAIDNFSATAQAVVAEATALGIDPFSADGAAAVNATLGALGLVQSPTPVPSQTSTPLPFPVITTALLDQGGHAIGTRYEFADPADLLTAQQAYERYFDFIAFRNGPPTHDFETALSRYARITDDLPSPQSCRVTNVANAITSLAERGRYIRLTPTSAIEWNSDAVYLSITPSGVEVELSWTSPNVLVEEVIIQSGQVVKHDSLLLAGTARLVYVGGSQAWTLVDDANGFYCNQFDFFVH